MSTLCEADYVVRSALGDVLPPLEEQQRWLDTALEDTRVGSFGRVLLNAAALSPTTGCLVLTDRVRGQGGYARTGVKQVSETGLASSSTGVHRAAFFLGPVNDHEQQRLFIDPEELTQHIDHICRNTACLHGNHVQPKTNQENNVLKLKARGLEAAIRNGQVFSSVGLPWLEELVRLEPERLASTTITTRYGAYRLQHVEDERTSLLYAERVPCKVLDRLKPPKSYQSRRRKIAGIAGQLALEDVT